MAVIDHPRGLRARRTLQGQVDFNQVILSTGGANTQTIMAGDPVTYDANGDVQKWPHGAVTAASTRIVGIAVSPLDTNRRPFTHNQPSSGPLIPPSTAGHVGVIIDPDVIYTVQWDTSAGRSDLFKFVTVTAGSGVTALGQSGIEAAGAASTAASLSHPFQIVGIADDLEGTPENPLDGGEANQDIEVVLRSGILTTRT